ncbi:MAG: hypothetical protein B9S34_00420 [Opitutia bacterium Tous-C1TDCM]|nr:MAG: hypothetical protein B9S34_00420 [Opitutae bacterium Tous-C1TDCM]
MPNVIPPAAVFGSPFTKAIKVTFNFAGGIAVDSYRKTGSEWVETIHHRGSVADQPVKFVLGVATQEQRGLYTVAAEDWRDAWGGNSQSLLGKHPGSSPHIFGDANFTTTGDPRIFSAPVLVHTLSKIHARSAKLVSNPGKPKPDSTFEALDDQTTMLVFEEGKVPRLAVVLWLEDDQTGLLQAESLPGADGKVAISL